MYAFLAFFLATESSARDGSGQIPSFSQLAQDLQGAKNDGVRVGVRVEVGGGGGSSGGCGCGCGGCVGVAAANSVAVCFGIPSIQMGLDDKTPCLFGFRCESHFLVIEKPLVFAYQYD